MTDRASDLSIEILDSFEGIEAAWGALALEAGNVFGTPEWAATWWLHYGRGRDLRVVACTTPDGRLAAILPLSVQRRIGLRVVRYLGVGPADELGPVCHADLRPAVAHALRLALTRLRADVLIADVHPADAGWREQLDGWSVDREPSPRIVFAGRTWDEYYLTRRSEMRRRLKRDERRLRESHGLSYRLTSEVTLASDLDALFAFHAARHGSSSNFVADEPFHRDFAAVALRNRWLWLRTLELDGRPAGAVIEFAYGRTVSAYQAGMDPAWSRYSIGSLLNREGMRESLGAGATEYRLLRGGEAYKYRWADKADDLVLETFALPRTARGRLGGLGVASVVRARHAAGALRRRTAIRLPAA
jgi:CelD/BcsL family acetyltransferase involved in cellulose biosynthesis